MRRDQEIVYLAGLLEGEGWFGTSKKWVRGKEYLNPGVAIQMVDDDIIYYVKRLIGHGSISKSILPSGKITYKYSTSGKKAIELMKELYLYMGTRRQGQINIALQLWEIKLENRAGGLDQNKVGKMESDSAKLAAS